jgi:hypothetical protein
MRWYSLNCETCFDILGQIVTVPNFFDMAKGKIISMFTAAWGESGDIIPALLGDIIELVTPPPGLGGERGWLIQEFLRYFGWA